MINKIKLEVAYASSVTNQFLISLEVDAGSTIEMAIIQSGLLEKYREIDLVKQKVGVFSESRQLSDEVKAGDRIEIYRPLVVEPKEARRKKAKYKKPT